jgi:hypothetical protein
MDPTNSVSRVLDYKRLKKYFLDKKKSKSKLKSKDDFIVDDDAEEEEEEESESESEPEETDDWFGKSLKEAQILFHQKPIDLRNKLIHLMTKALKDNANAKELIISFGGAILNCTSWPWQETNPKSRSKIWPPIAEAAIAEHFAIIRYRASLLTSSRGGRLFRNDLAKLITSCLTVKDGKQQEYQWWDTIDVDLKSANNDLPGSIRELLRSLEVSRMAQRDRAEIKHFIELIERSPVAKVARSKRLGPNEEPISFEVAEAVTFLYEVSFLSYLSK